jgi:hypothetical protein
MPGDLESRRWSDPEVERRALRLVDGIVGRFRGQVKWFMFANEIDGAPKLSWMVFTRELAQ